MSNVLAVQKNHGVQKLSQQNFGVQLRNAVAIVEYPLQFAAGCHFEYQNVLAGRFVELQ